MIRPEPPAPLPCAQGSTAAGQVCHGRNRNDERLDPCDMLSCLIL